MIIRTGVVHLLRNSFRHAGHQRRVLTTKALKPVCTAPTEVTARERFAAFIGVRAAAIR